MTERIDRVADFMMCIAHDALTDAWQEMQTIMDKYPDITPAQRAELLDRTREYIQEIVKK